MTLNEYAEKIHKTAVEHGWWEADRNFGEVCALVHSEVSEAFEEYRDGKGTLYYEEANPGKPEGIGVEWADVLIRLLDYAASEGWDMDFLVSTKMAYNESRPYRHGGKLA